MKIQPRDKFLMEQLYRFGVLTTSQVRRICFKDIATTTVLRRLRILETENLILRLSGLEGGLLCWSLTNNGADKVGMDRPTEYRNKNILRHTTVLADVRLALMSIGLGQNWTSEVEMRRQAYVPGIRNEAVIPDGLFPAQTFGKNQIVALELELNPKSLARYQELFRQYSYKNAIGILWYIVESQPLGESILRIWDTTLKTKNAPEFFVSSLSELLVDPLNSELTSSTEKVKLRDAFNIQNHDSIAHTAAQALSTKTTEPMSSKPNKTSQAMSVV